MDIYRGSLLLHIVAGTVALATFWVAAAMTKGTARHRRVGQAYLLSMTLVLVTAVPLAVITLGSGRPVTAAFLGFLVLITGQGCWNAWRAIRARRSVRHYFGRPYWIVNALVFVSGMAVMALGLRTGTTLLVVFGALGAFFLIVSIVHYRRAARDPKWWLREHYSAMIGNGVATHIAFLGIGLRNAVPGLDPALVQGIAWFGPLLIAVIAAFWLDRRYGTARPGARLRQVGPARS